MRLNNSQKSAFVSAVMQDVPQINYGQLISNKIIEHAVSKLPKKVLEIYNDKDLRHFVAKGNTYFNNVGRYYHPGMDDIQIPDKLREELEELRSKMSEQSKARDEMASKLRAVISGCATRKAAATLLPEFEKYLPNEAAESTKGVPMITDLVASLTKLGWPSSGKSEQENATNDSQELVAA